MIRALRDLLDRVVADPRWPPAAFVLTVCGVLWAFDAWLWT